jgi:hypothetical protein
MITLQPAKDTLLLLSERIEADGQVDMFDIGGCGCFTDGEGQK